MTENIELNFKNEYLLCTRSIVTSLVMSLEFNPIPCATMLCHFGQTRNGSVTTHFILLSSTAMSSGTGGYVVVAERFGENKGPVSRNEELTRKKLSFVPEDVINQCSEITRIFLTCNHDFLKYFFNIDEFYKIFLLWENLLILCFVLIFFVLAREEAL